MKFLLLILIILAVVIGLIWGGAHLGGNVGNTMIGIGVLAIVVVLILGGMLYRGLQT